jgi:dihydrofolate synthase/folylpolyglutamate synthase
MGILADKDAHGIVDELAPLAARIHVTQSQSDRAIPAEELAERVGEWAHDAPRYEFDTLDDALSAAREWADAAPGRAVLVTGSITLVGEAIELATAQGWKR